MKNIIIKIITVMIPIISVVIPIFWDLLKEENKELTIREERKINILNTFGRDFNIYTKDSIKLNNYIFLEYSIVNTGNKTIIGYGDNSDILTSDNSLCIAPDSIIVNLYDDNNIVHLEDNSIKFKQIRPGEKISLICATNRKTEDCVLSINDRDIKETNLKYISFNDKLTTFERTSTKDKWNQVVIFSVNLIFLIIIIVISIVDYFNKEEILSTIWIILWLLYVVYTLTLPIRWLL